MSIITFRAVEERDYEEICLLPQNEEELFFMFPKAKYPLSINYLEESLQNRYEATVFLLNKKIVGYANYYELEEKQYCSIGNVVVSPLHRGKGIGEFIINTMEHIGTEKYDISEFHLSCFNMNTNGILLYTKLGYRPYTIDKWINTENKPIALIKMKKIVSKRF